MKQHKNKVFFVLGLLLLLISIGLFILQVGYLLLQDRLYMEYIDNRLFYIITIFIVSCLYVAIVILFTFTKKIKVIVAGFTGLFIIVNLFLLIQSDKEIKNIISISPDFKNVFSIKKDNFDNGIYNRSYYRIVSRPKEVIDYPIIGAYNVEWLADDVAVFTYETNDDKLQAFVGTYGDRNQGLSYYYVGSEIQGIWQDGDVKVTSKPEGIEVIEKNNVEFFEWENIKQFGTLAIVLERDGEAKWTIALNSDFEVHSDETVTQTGSISLFKPMIEDKESYHLTYESPN